MKIVSLNHSQYRRWRSNRMALVDSQGDFVRYATEGEADAAETARKRGTVVKVREGDRELSFTTDRDVLKQELLRQYGSCRIQLFNRHTVAMVHDPNTSRLSAPAPADASRVSPEHCQCAKWGGRQPGKHHPACQYNKLAPPEQQGHPRTQVIDAEVVVAVPEAETPAAPGGFIPAPEECACRDWAKPGDSDPNLHHPTCEWFDAWNLRGVKGWGLYDLNGDYRRPASTEEVTAARESAEANGTPVVTIDGLEYVVLEEESASVDTAAAV